MMSVYWESKRSFYIFDEVLSVFFFFSVEKLSSVFTIHFSNAYVWVEPRFLCWLFLFIWNVADVHYDIFRPLYRIISFAKWTSRVIYQKEANFL